MPIFPLLADPANYQPNTIDMVADLRARDYWLNVFESQLPRKVALAAASQANTAEAQARARRWGEAFGGILADIRRDPLSHGPLSIIMLCTLRERLLLEHGFDDMYRGIKQAENAAALDILPALLAEHDAIGDETQKLLTLVRGVFAGNIFDLGCEGTTKMYESGQIGFHATREARTGRPWLVDDFDALAARLASRRHREAVMFVDNAGSDVVLGMVPLARHLLQRGTRVVLTANTQPALNDIMHHELVALIDVVAGLDAVIRQARDGGELRLIGSGNGIPGIDLREVSAELADAAAGADLLVIEGMGRALETNYHARFTVDALKLAMVKEHAIAELLGGRLYDVVCRFEPAGA